MAALLSKRIKTFSNGTYQIESFTPIPSGTMQYYMQKEDIESGVFLNEEGNPKLRDCAYSGGCPAVFTFMNPLLKVTLDKHWQFYLIAINYHMTLENVSKLLDKSLAFCNGTGFRSEPMRNYILGVDLNVVDARGRPVYPKFDKDRTCSRSVMTGIEVGSTLRVLTLDGNQPPPLKPGKTYPQEIGAIRPDDYLYHPKHPEHRHLFFAANVVASKPGGQSSVAPFPRGAIYDWTGDNLPYSWMPHVSRHVIYYPLSRVRKLGLGSPIPSPFRIVR